MTKETALKVLLEEYPTGRMYEGFFRGVIDSFVGDSKIVDDYCFSQIKLYLKSLT